MSFTMLHLNGIKEYEDWFAKKREREAERDIVNRHMQDPSVPGVDKMHRRCQYILKYGRNLFTCPGCWLLPGLCVCGFMAKVDAKTQLVVHVHQTEWGKCSNTGCVAHLSVPGSKLLLKGYKDHDAQLTALFADPTITTAILWPGERSILPSELKAIADAKTGGRIAVVAVDATWDGAMRMKCSYPPDALHVKLPPNSALAHSPVSLLSPVRKYRGDLENNGRVSTLEAIAALMCELEGDLGVRDTMLHNLRIKVDAMLIQKNRETVYGTVGAEMAEKVKEEARLVGERMAAEMAAAGVDVAALQRELAQEAKISDD